MVLLPFIHKLAFPLSFGLVLPFLLPIGTVQVLTSLEGRRMGGLIEYPLYPRARWRLAFRAFTSPFHVPLDALLDLTNADHAILVIESRNW